MKKEEIKKDLITKHLEFKSKTYELSKGEEEIIDKTSSIIESILEDSKYLTDTNKRLLNEKLNLEETVEELRDKIKELNNIIKRLE
jgi:hypothetical protein